METKGLYRQMAKVALPISVQGLVTSSLTLVDNLMVGSLGESELSSVGVAANVFFVYYLLCWGFCAGGATFLAQFFGAGDKDHIRKTLGLMTTICSGVALVFFLVTFLAPVAVMSLFTDIDVMLDIGQGYMRIGSFSMLFLAITIPGEAALRAVQKPNLPLIVGIISFSTNTLLNYILIFGKFGAPALGVEGAAIATSTARALEAFLILRFVLSRHSALGGQLRDYLGWGRELARRVIYNAIPTTINESLWGLGVTMYAAAFARVSVTAYASVQASLAINDLFEMASFGVGDASLILLGQKLGEGKLEEARLYGKKFLRAGLVVGLALGFLLFVFGRPIVSLFDFTPEGAAYTRSILRFFSFYLVINLLNAILVTGVLRSGGDTRFAMVADAGSVWVLGVPAAFLTALVLHWPIDLCVASTFLEGVVKLVVLYWRYRQGKWVKNVISGL